MKRFRAFVLAMLILFMCTACKKETLPATQPAAHRQRQGRRSRLFPAFPSASRLRSTDWPARSRRG